ncbi:hypothetical protein PHYSODRAFT_284903 [Phytophthora sojae]|uniref:Heterogeneous nuclear ribonucleoprotein Q acidic domain-containing protein n=1 Tax=Phytophthora sojae (strain P6497) TaxID=1094619 RepID=G4YUB8_PHYSP|nr:hypothetical protein PHYSODRAFT_284903 [Phytophthora sojae]EGZ24302.1 hypothetical protein PHYSODRAFT_284903 [Phytophthora sojae]|eukprot:XP_009519590.1 hypothetical protein PHYSODRAFT_284903 [Phytophthora sojae]
MEPEGPAASAADVVSEHVLSEQAPASDAALTTTANDTAITAHEETQSETQEAAGAPDLQLDDGASNQPEQSDGPVQSEAPAAAEEQDAENAQQVDVEMEEASEDAAPPASDPAVADEVDAASAQQESETVAGNDTLETSTHEEPLPVSAPNVEEPASNSESLPEEAAPEDASTQQADENVEPAATVQPSADAALPAEEALVDSSADVAGASASPPPTHDESEYDPSAPAINASAVPHGEDEYDPANPSPIGTPVATGFGDHRPAAEQEEYDPDHPSMTSSAANDEPVAMDVDQSSSATASGEQSNATPAKRKADEVPNASSDAPVNGDVDPKRPRLGSNESSHHDDDHKHGRRRRGSSDATASPSTSKHKRLEEDHKGLSAAAWDRLMDFQTSGEFKVTQVSRAAFASVGAMPEFAQIAIIARFVRTPMRDVRDKNGQLMRIYREYQKENPQVAALQPVDAFISDYKSDPGLFRFGYAPPQPATGVSTVQVPYQRDQPEEDAPVKHSPRQARAASTRSEPQQNQQKSVDEFGRVAHNGKASAQNSNAPANPPSQRPAASDPRLASRSRQGPPSPVSQAMPRSATSARAEDPRRREQPHAQGPSGLVRDPRRRGSSTNQQQSPRGSQPGPSRPAGSNDLFDRLPVAVKTVVNSMRREGRLQEPLNDNVVTRLLHLPERVALQAVENFSNVDLSQVENLQGFLVGIINRVNEKAIASEKQQRRSQAPSPRGHTQAALPRGSGGYAAVPQGGSVLGGPPQGGRLNGANGANGGAYRGQGAPMAAGPGPALYERPYEAPQDSRDPRRRQPAAPQSVQPPQQFGGAVRGPPPVGAGRGGPGMGIPSFAALPMSVQNHIHSLVANRTLSSLEELGGKCYEVLGQLSEPLANQVLTRFAGANLSNVRNKSGFLVGVVKRARQEYGFN